MKNQCGFSLVGLMVGIFVGLLVALAVLGTASFMEAQRRTAGGANTALSSAASGMFVLDKAVRQAGLGMMVPGGFACPALNLAYNGSVRADAATVYPASIVDGGAGSDQLTLAYLDTLLAAAPPRLLLPQSSPDAGFRIASMDGIAAGKLLLLQDASALQPCTLMQASTVTPMSVGADIAHAGGPFNTSGASFAIPVRYLDNSKAAPANAFRWLTYRVNTTPASPNYLSLEELDNVTGSVTVIAEDVVSMQAQYGIVAPGGGVLSWTDAADNSALAPPDNVNWLAPGAADMLRVRALRIAIVAKSQDADATSANACDAGAPNRSATQYRYLIAWTGRPPTADPLAADPAADGPTIDLAAAAGPKWCHFRYRTVSLMLPLLNVRMGARQ